MSKNITQNDELNDWVDALENLILFNGKENASNLLEEFLNMLKIKALLSKLISHYLFKILFLNMKRSIIQVIGILKKRLGTISGGMR